MGLWEILQTFCFFFIEGPTSFADVSRNLFSTSNCPGYLAHQGPWLPWPPWCYWTRSFVVVLFSSFDVGSIPKSYLTTSLLTSFVGDRNLNLLLQNIKLRLHLKDVRVDARIIVEVQVTRRLWIRRLLLRIIPSAHAFGFLCLSSNVAIGWLTILLRMWEVLVSNLSPETDSTGDFTQSLQENSVIVSQIRPRPLSSTSFPIHHSSVVLSLDCT
jgi:hypothetical protein